LLDSQPFERFMMFSDWLYATTQKTHQLALERLFDLLHTYLTTILYHDINTVETPLLADYGATGAKGKLGFMKRGLSITDSTHPTQKSVSTPPRQQRHHAA
jgi:hypothetical protein